MSKKKDEKILEQSYTIEALEDEIAQLEGVAAENHAKLWTIIQENDRLTLTYEPYRPPGDENENIGYYDLIDDNKELCVTIDNLRTTIAELRRTIQVNKDKIKGPRIKNERWWNVSVELWPGAWGLNYYRYDWQRAQRNGNPGTSREGNFQIGPLGFSWNREPKS